jgi:hypothetical protein
VNAFHFVQETKSCANWSMQKSKACKVRGSRHARHVRESADSPLIVPGYNYTLRAIKTTVTRGGNERE